mmetsp:Transcript_10180/g.11928  ORF Transcript_10180/g.11928 Transcript_10180/m.11928 type:complete len:411 (-) Transcript_10180:553-1785(-)|eukprot:CAMPEP_0197850034 /NCGR_PEP_ID=MMETSP1438-20131217/14050_1 /TAXON_ID=1461541 /ORGANISM="Pterosperma sp., Strain CCMP1384" /LENGTH=410 /DNA_ID=CAMNT_0043462983 /DNA_START=192 /DNA_END=1424 /DNA_ORIENTATION=+
MAEEEPTDLQEESEEVNEIDEAEKQRLVAAFVEGTEADDSLAWSFLEAHDWNLQDGMEDYKSQLQMEDDLEEVDVDAAEEVISPPPSAKEGMTAGEEVADEEVALEDTPPPPAEKESTAENQPLSHEAADIDESGVAQASAGDFGTNDGDDTFKQVDEVAQRLKNQAPEIAEQIGKEAKEALAKITGGLGGFGLGSSTFGLGPPAASEPETDAAAPLNNVANRLSSWWSSLDNLGADEGAAANSTSSAAATDSASSQASGQDDQVVLHQLFPALPTTDKLIETFPCKLLQTYRCFHNSHTPDIQMAFQGTLYITDKHTCFNVEERGRKLPIIVEHATVSQVERQRPARRSDKNDILKLLLGGSAETTNQEEKEKEKESEKEPVEQWIALKDFGPGSLDSALALLEHLCSK